MGWLKVYWEVKGSQGIELMEIVNIFLRLKWIVELERAGYPFHHVCNELIVDMRTAAEGKQDGLKNAKVCKKGKPRSSAVSGKQIITKYLIFFLIYKIPLGEAEISCHFHAIFTAGKWNF